MLPPPGVAWFRVQAPTFVCAVKVEQGTVVDAAPVLRWILARRDRSLAWLESYCAAHSWTLDQLTED